VYDAAPEEVVAVAFEPAAVVADLGVGAPAAGISVVFITLVQLSVCWDRP